MNSKVLPQFWNLYYKLPKVIRRQTAKTYWHWCTHPRSPGLQFKRVGKNNPVYSVRITDDYRALGLLESNTIYWFWIGSHDKFERIIKTI